MLPPSARRTLMILGAVLFLALAAGVYLAPRFTLTPAASFGPPLRAGKRVYLLTGQWQRNFDFTDDSSRLYSSTDLLVDIWAFDAATTQPIFRRRVQTIREGAMQGRSILGAHSRSLWLLLPTGPYAVDLETGMLAASPERIAEINPQLRGLIPVEPRFFTFNADGLAIKTADARTVYIHPDTFRASETPPSVRGGTILPSFFTPQASHVYLERGVTAGKKWIGLMNAKEVVTMTDNKGISDLDYESRRALYAFDVTQRNTFFGPQPHYSNPKRLTEEFLAPGLLAEHRATGNGSLLLRRDPDSVFVLYKDRLGENGRLQLARIAGPDGRVLWNVSIVLSVLQSVLPDDDCLVLYGVLYRPQDPAAPVHTDPMHSAREMLVSVNWATGAVRYHDQSDASRHPEATPAQ